MPYWNDLYFMDAGSPIMEQMIFFHDHSMIVVITILILISYILMKNMFNKILCLTFHEGQMIEMIWTILPVLMLMFIALPSLRLLYLMEESYSPDLTMKIMGHQWYWSYEYSDFMKSFDSFIVSENNLSNNMFRLLEVDNRFALPLNVHSRLFVSSSDVIHSWTIPSFGVKTDAIPGRMNQLNILPIRLGVFYGQCSEICGANHSFMPIVLEVLPLSSFISWLKK